MGFISPQIENFKIYPNSGGKSATDHESPQSVQVNYNKLAFY